MSVDDLETATLEIPLPVPSAFPPEQDEDMDLEQRCGKPFTDSIEADRYALSLESLSSPTTGTRVSAVSVRQSVFRAFFFGYLQPQVTASQDSSRYAQEYDNFAMTAGSESFGLAPEPRDIVHPTEVPSSGDPIRTWLVLSLIQNSRNLLRLRTSDSRSQSSGLSGLFCFRTIEKPLTHFSNN